MKEGMIKKPARALIMGAALFGAFSAQAGAQELKKVAIIGFINTEKKVESQYLEGSIHDTVEKSLEDSFAFKKISRETIAKTAGENYLFRDDFASFSVALNLGLLTKSDVVVTGSFRTRESDRVNTIITRVLIIDVGQKKIRDDFTVEGPVDSRIWDTVNKIAARVRTAMGVILPNREEWQRKYARDEERKVDVAEKKGPGKKEGEKPGEERFSSFRVGVGKPQDKMGGYYKSKAIIAFDLYPYRMRGENGAGIDVHTRFHVTLGDGSQEHIIRDIAAHDQIFVPANSDLYIEKDKLFALSAGIKYNFSYLSRGVQWQYYCIGAYQYINDTMTVGITSTQERYKKVYTSKLGFLAAFGMEMAVTNRNGLFLEISYGYSPMKFLGKTINADGYNLIAGTTLRTSLF